MFKKEQITFFANNTAKKKALPSIPINNLMSIILSIYFDSLSAQDFQNRAPQANAHKAQLTLDAFTHKLS